MAVEIYQHDSLECTTVWCFRCIEEAEQRSQPHDATIMPEGVSSTLLVASATQTPHSETTSGIFEQLIQEHLGLMDRALYDEEALLIPVIHAFMARCQCYQAEIENPKQGQRLAGQLHYWETFLKALNS